MIKGKEMAKLFKNSTGLTIETDNGDIFVTDGYMLVKLSEEEYQEFRFKWSGYSKNAPIPELKAKCLRHIGKEFISEDENRISKIIPQNIGNYNVILTPYIRKGKECLSKIYKKSNGELGIINNSYAEFIENIGITEIKSPEGMKPLECYHNNELLILVAPIRPKSIDGNNPTSIKKELEDLLKLE